MQPSELQAKASDPNYSVWVSASAGSGKTKVLTDRVLRLLLAGTPPSKILCITYTKAGASEMRGRIDKRLGKWVMMEEAALTDELHALTGLNPGTGMIALARQLFARVIEDEVGLRIQTIHAFCQSLLARFPVEANVPPHFTLIEDEAAAHLLAEAKGRLASGEMGGEAPELIAAIKKMARSGSEWAFDELLNALVKRRKELSALSFNQGSDAKQSWDMFSLFGVPDSIRDITSFQEWCVLSPAELSDLKQLCQWASEGSANDLKCHAILTRFLGQPRPLIDDYIHLGKAFFNTEGEPKKNVFTVKLAEKYPSCLPMIARLSERVGTIRQTWNAYLTAERSEAVMVIARHLYHIYATLKHERSALDYDDLIFKARELLLSEQSLGWVMYKLDGGIDHVLVDEAQDTSREQWEITAALVREFFSGAGAHDTERTLFVVGDAKQSIFRFQGAYPEGFFQYREYFTELARLAGMEFHWVPMTTSFRSSPAILKAVDEVFAGDAAAGLGQDYQPHLAFHSQLPGRIELWPLFKSGQKEARQSWRAPLVPEERERGEAQLAEKIASQIALWIREKRILPATGKAIQPKDIMILLRKREPMANEMLAALRAHGIPSSGLDRLALTEDIAVKDMLALGQFLLLPEDDLSLASVLKSPLYEVSEETLFQLCFARGQESLWHRVQHYHGPDAKVSAAYEELHDLLGKTDFISPYAMFANVLKTRNGMCKMIARLGEHVREVLETFLNEALRYEQNETPSLQGFCHWLMRSDQIVKREQEQQADQVRILTVHGAKGLEAPIVFLAHTAVPPTIKNDDKLVALHDQGVIVSLPGSGGYTPLTQALYADLQQQLMEEYQRLLYVALTRAKHELYVTGTLASNRKQASLSSWYVTVKRGLEKLPHRWVGETLVYEEAGQQTIQEKENAGLDIVSALPEHFRQNARKEHVPTVLNPSHLEQEKGEVVPFSLLPPQERKLRAERGTVIHRLLEILPTVRAEKQHEIGLKITARHAPRRAAAERAQWVEAVMALIRKEEYATIFSTQALAEVPVAGTLRDGRPITGQIDRLLIEGKEIKIIDFKTGKQETGAPSDSKYKAQMLAYADLLGQAYPDKKVRAGLLFTETPEILWIKQ